MKTHQNHGYSIVEIIVYLAIFSLISITVINSFLIVTRTSTSTKITGMVMENGQVVLDRMALEIHQATAVDTANSTLGTNPGILSLSSVDLHGNPITVRFLIENGALVVYHNTTRVGILTDDSVSVTNLVFRRVTTPHSEAVKIELSLASTSKKLLTQANFYDTIVVRGAY